MYLSNKLFIKEKATFSINIIGIDVQLRNMPNINGSTWNFQKIVSNKIFINVSLWWINTCFVRKYVK